MDLKDKVVAYLPVVYKFLSTSINNDCLFSQPCNTNITKDCKVFMKYSLH